MAGDTVDATCEHCKQGEPHRVMGDGAEGENLGFEKEQRHSAENVRSDCENERNRAEHDAAAGGETKQ